MYIYYMIWYELHMNYKLFILNLTWIFAILTFICSYFLSKQLFDIYRFIYFWWLRKNLIFAHISMLFVDLKNFNHKLSGSSYVVELKFVILIPVLTKKNRRKRCNITSGYSSRGCWNPFCMIKHLNKDFWLEPLFILGWDPF